MLNAKGERELAYVVKIDGISPIAGADRVEQAQLYQLLSPELIELSLLMLADGELW